MDKQLMDIVLPGLAKRLHRHLERYRSGELSDAQLNRRFEAVLTRQYAWLADHGVAEPDAALLIHAAVLVLSGPGMRAEATDENLPLEVIEHRAVRAAAKDLADCYGVSLTRATRQLSAIVAKYSE